VKENCPGIGKDPVKYHQEERNKKNCIKVINDRKQLISFLQLALGKPSYSLGSYFENTGGPGASDERHKFTTQMLKKILDVATCDR
jgi:hypothetical protein